MKIPKKLKLQQIAFNHSSEPTKATKAKTKRKISSLKLHEDF